MCQQKSEDGKTKLHFEKWKKVTTTELMQRHIMIQKHHRELLVEPEQSPPKHFHQPLFQDKWPASKCLQFTKKMTYDLVVQYKEPLALFERKGFRRFIRREFPGYSISDRDKVSQIADECGTESRDAVIHSLKEHFCKHGTVSSDIHQWTPRRNIGSVVFEVLILWRKAAPGEQQWGQEEPLEPLCGTDLWGRVGAGPGGGGGWGVGEPCGVGVGVDVRTNVRRTRCFVHICAPHIKLHAQHA